MKRFGSLVGGVIALLILVAAGHMAFIEIGREVVVLSTTDTGGERHQRRLWAVDFDGAVWLHSTGTSWHALFAQPVTVGLARNGKVSVYRATPVPGPHPEIDRLLREKYGLADRWVRFLAPDDPDVLVVRLDPVDDQSSG
ncbi:MAG: hypothetical protein H6993_05355 [Pseudomonadales bacterium]|nr:hypothetical protein [Pseudomonadales bacterium]MCP5183368.1 hypothetical protein [Pseudomonadales bacterium]